MATRNLHQTWREVIFNQYALDHATDVPFPVRYLIFASPWQRDIFIEIPNKTEPHIVRRSGLDFVAAKRHDADPAFNNGHIFVWAWEQGDVDADPTSEVTLGDEGMDQSVNRSPKVGSTENSG